MKLVIGADHGGVEMKAELKERLVKAGHTVADVGTMDTASVDYPDIAEKLCKEVLSGGYDRGILICGTGIGMSIAANKIHGIRAALITDTYSAKMASAHNNANVVALGARTLGIELAWEILEANLNTAHLGGRHAARVAKIMALEEKQ